MKPPSSAASAAAWAAATGHLRNASTSWAVALAVTSSLTPHLVPLGDQVVVAPDARMDGVLGKLQDGEANRVLVAQDDEVVGIITPSDLTRWLRRWRTLELRAR
jgi:CBS-domain-containing membrane protein